LSKGEVGIRSLFSFTGTNEYIYKKQIEQEESVVLLTEVRVHPPPFNQRRKNPNPACPVYLSHRAYAFEGEIQ